MVIQKAVDNLKERPKDERKAVAGGIAVAVAATLLIGWGLLFFKKIQRDGVNRQFGGTAQDEFNFSSVRDAQDQLVKEENTSNEDELRKLREESASQQVPYSPPQGQGEGNAEPFGN